jgi:hypothetical protein
VKSMPIFHQNLASSGPTSDLLSDGVAELSIPVVLRFLVVVIWDAIIPLETVVGSTVNAY